MFSDQVQLDLEMVVIDGLVARDVDMQVVGLGAGQVLHRHDFAQAIEAQMHPGLELEHFTDWAGKAPGAAARLAGVLHGIKHAHGRLEDH